MKKITPAIATRPATVKYKSSKPTVLGPSGSSGSPSVESVGNSVGVTGGVVVSGDGTGVSVGVGVASGATIEG